MKTDLQDNPEEAPGSDLQLKPLPFGHSAGRLQFDGLMEMAPDGIAVYEFSHSATAVFIGANPAFCTLLGYPLHEIRGLSPFQIVAPEERITLPEVLKTLHSKKSLCHQKTLVAKDGRRIPVEIMARLIPHQERLLVLSVVRDVSLRQSMAGALRESEETYRQLVETSPDAILVHSAGAIVYANRAALKLFGAEDSGQMIDLSALDMENLDCLSSVCQVMQQAPQSGKSTPGREVKVFRLDGQMIEVEAVGSAIAYQGKQATQVVLHDIRGRKHAEWEREAKIDFLRLVNHSKGLSDLLRKSLRFFQKKSSCEAAGVRLKDGDDYPYSETRGFTPAFLQLENSLCARDELGMPRLDNTGKPVFDCMCGNVICGRFDPSQAFFTARGSFWTNSTTELLSQTTEEHRQARKGNRCNSEGYESVALFPLFVGNQRLGLLQLNDRRKGLFSPEVIAMYERLADDLAFAISRIITENELRRAHEELEQRVQERTAELAKALKDLQEKEHMLLQQSRLAAMGEMINNIAHQWRQPLNALGLNIQRLGLFHDYGHLTKELLDQSVTASMKLINHMSRTIDDFRNFFKPDKDKLQFRGSLVVANAISLITGSFNHHHIGIDVECISDPLIYGYQNEYSQVLLNILMNARDAFKAGSKVDNRRVLITISEQEGKSIIAITDNAGGIPADILERIFDPYFTTKGPSGTGIGLFMAQNIIEKSMDGRLTARNTGDGAEFRIEV